MIVDVSEYLVKVLRMECFLLGIHLGIHCLQIQFRIDYQGPVLILDQHIRLHDWHSLDFIFCIPRNLFGFDLKTGIVLIVIVFLVVV